MATTRKTQAQKATAAVADNSEPVFSGVPGDEIVIERRDDFFNQVPGWGYGNVQVFYVIDKTGDEPVATTHSIIFNGDHSLNIAELANPIHDYDLKFLEANKELEGMAIALFICEIDRAKKSVTPSKVFVYHNGLEESERRAIRRSVFDDTLAALHVGTKVVLKAEPVKATATTTTAKKPTAAKKPAPVKKATAAKKPSAAKKPPVAKTAPTPIKRTAPKRAAVKATSSPIVSKRPVAKKANPTEES